MCPAAPCSPREAAVAIESPVATESSESAEASDSFMESKEGLLSWKGIQPLPGITSCAHQNVACLYLEVLFLFDLAWLKKVAALSCNGELGDHKAAAT